MKTFCQAHKKALRRGLLALLVLWAVWYARPVDVYDLMGGEAPGYLQISVFPQFSFPEVVHDDLLLAAGEPEMDAVLERLEDIRFHRNPLEIFLQFLPQGTRTTKVDPEKDYSMDFSAFDRDGRLILNLRFQIQGWYRTAWGLDRELPLYVFHGQEKGRELGAWLWELSHSDDY